MKQTTEGARGTKRKPPLAGASLRRAVREVAARHLDLAEYRVFLFGSEAAGTARVGADIDLGLWGPRPLPAAVLQRIRDDLDKLRTLRPFDVVDFARTDASFRDVALQRIEPLDEQDVQPPR